MVKDLKRRAFLKFLTYLASGFFFPHETNISSSAESDNS
jgi:hypothetical protein